MVVSWGMQVAGDLGPVCEKLGSVKGHSEETNEDERNRESPYE